MPHMIRLPEAFRTSLDGEYDTTVYKTNLAIIESLLKEQDVSIDPVNEAALGNVDLDKDGKIGTAHKITYDWAPLEERFMWYAGKANALQKAGKCIWLPDCIRRARSFCIPYAIPAHRSECVKVRRIH